MDYGWYQTHWPSRDSVEHHLQLVLASSQRTVLFCCPRLVVVDVVMVVVVVEVSVAVVAVVVVVVVVVFVVAATVHRRHLSLAVLNGLRAQL